VVGGPPTELVLLRSTSPGGGIVFFRDEDQTRQTVVENLGSRWSLVDLGGKSWGQEGKGANKEMRQSVDGDKGNGR